jgi:predicted glycoside hydrolase/deacetylase ChbG (UPF0249 family)
MLEEKRKNLIISADDFGKSELANRNILRLAETGKLDRVSVMIEGDMSEEEVKKLLATGVKLDIHLELVWQKRRRNLLEDITVRQGIVFLVNYIWGDWPVPEHPRSGAKTARKEWGAQIEKFQKIFGRYPDGINSHEHTHYFPVYFKIALKHAKQFEIPYIRFGKEGLVGNWCLTKYIINCTKFLDRKKFLKSTLSSSEYLASLDWINNLDEFLRELPSGRTELTCHPEREEEMELINKYF